MKRKIHLLSKSLLAVAAILMFATSICAQTPNSMSYQAVVRDASDNLVVNSTVGMRISILIGSATGPSVYVETQSPNTNDNGLLSIAVGQGTPVSGNFGDIDWGNGAYFIKTEIDPAGGSSYTISGTSQLLSVPYALHAGNNPWEKGTTYPNEITFSDEVSDTTMVSIGYKGLYNLVESGRFAFDENISVAGICGFEFHHNGQVNKLFLKTGCLGSGILDDTLMTWDRNNDRVGIGTANPTEDLHVKGSTKLEGPTKFGSSSTEILEIREITGTTSSTNDWVNITYPAGFSSSNTRILSAELKVSGNFWRSQGYATTNGNIYTSLSTSIYLYYPDETACKNRQYRIVLMKVQ